MSAWYVWTKRDTGAGGWEYDPSASSVRDPDLDHIIETLASNNGFPQLEPLTVALPSTERIPIVSAVWDDRLSRWVFFLRGRGGVFGPAGATQVSVAPAGLPLARAWQDFWAAIGFDHIAREDRLDVAPSEVPVAATPSAVLGVLRLVAQGAEYSEVDATPAEAATLIASTVRLLPEGVAQRCCWSTLHVARLGVRPVVIGGRWPEELQHAWDARYQRLARTDDSLVTPLGVSDDALLTWWASQPDHGWVSESPATSMAAFLDELRRRRPLDLDQVKALLASGHLTQEQVTRILQQRELVQALIEDEPETGWAVQRWAAHGLPGAASFGARLLLTDTDQAVALRSRMREQVLQGAVVESAFGTQTLDQQERRKLAHLILDASLGQDAELAAARSWLQSLGITPGDAPDFFGFVAEEVASLAQTDPDNALAQIGGGEQKWERLTEVIRILGPRQKATVWLLTASVPDDPRLGARILAGIRPIPHEVSELARSLGNFVAGHDHEWLLRRRLSTALWRWACLSDALDPDSRDPAALLELATGVSQDQFMIKRTKTVTQVPASSDAGDHPLGGVGTSTRRVHHDATARTQALPGSPNTPTERLPDTSDRADRPIPPEDLPRGAHLATTRDRSRSLLRLLARPWVRAGLIALALVAVVAVIVLANGAFK